MRKAMFAILLLTGCNDGAIVPLPEPAPLDPAPTSPPAPTPVPCSFYGVDNDGVLWEIDPSSTTALYVGQTEEDDVTDLTITHDGRLIGIGFDRAFSLDPATGAATPLATEPWVLNQNSLDETPDGRLLVGGLQNLAAVDLSTGTVTPIGSLPGPLKYSGDVTSAGPGSALGSVADSQIVNDRLFALDLTTGSADEIGSLGVPEVYGLDWGCDGLLYAVADGDPPRLLRVNPATGQTIVLAALEGPTSLWGGTGPAVP